MPKAAGSSLNRVCLCQSHGCGAMHFITKMGERKTGAEVNYRTQRSHRLQDRELEIRQASLARKEVSRKVDEEEEVSKSQRTAIVMQHIAGLTANPENEPAAETIASTSLNVELVGLDGGLTNQDLQNQENPGEIPGEVVHVLSTEVSVGGEPKVYDCGMHLPLLLLAKLNTDVEPLDRFYQLDWPKLQPSVLHSLLVASMMSIMEHSSLSTASWLLGTQRDSILLAARLGLSLTASNPRELDYTEEKVIRGIPKFITTAIKKLGIDPKLNKVVCCRKCFATYTPDKKIAFCTNTRFSEQEVQEGQEKVDEADIDPELIVANNMCGEPLLKEGPTGLKPIRYYAFQNLADWIGRMLSRNGMEEALDSSLKDSCAPFDPNVAVKDIHSSSAWKQFRGADGSQFTAKSGNLTFGLFVDGINPYGNKASGKKASITFLVLVCLTLPWQVRHLPKNLFLVGIAPGPREPKVDQINSILESMVEQFKELWEPGIWLTRTAAHPEGRRICAGLLAVFADLPALRRTLGFSSISHTLLCSFCYVKRRDIDNIDAASWPRRTAAEHALWSEKDKAAQTEKEREFILKNYGLRYSVLSELPYWNAIEGQTVDSMHNLLLGFLAWHCRQAWAMQDIRDTEDEPGDIPMRGVLEVNADGARMLETALHPSLRPSQVHSVDQEDQGEEQQVSWLELPFGSESSENNEDFTSAQVLVEEDEGWDGTWTKPPTEKIIFDREMLAHINSILPRIHIPTWIKQPIRVLGQASNGKLKADEWRTLFTVQLVLILVPAWSLGPEEQSLLQNFGHLVALVNLALKRSMTSERIDAYEKHLSTYLEGTKELFEHLSLRPNHHMAFHLGECLRRFGPVRAWWCFVFERLMGRILKGSHNNHLGELEITFMINYCRGGNLQEVLESDQMPSVLKPYISQISSLYDPKPHSSEGVDSVLRLSSLSAEIFQLLIQKLNAISREDDGIVWVGSHLWCEMDNNRYYGSVSSQVEFMRYVAIRGEKYANKISNENNSVIVFRKKAPDKIFFQTFGQIEEIFQHRRITPNNTSTCETFIAVSMYSTGLPAACDVFKQLGIQELQAHVFFERPRTLVIVRPEEVIAHAAWVIYHGGEFHEKIEQHTIALVNTSRE